MNVSWCLGGKWMVNVSQVTHCLNLIKPILANVCNVRRTVKICPAAQVFHGCRKTAVTVIHLDLPVNDNPYSNVVRLLKLAGKPVELMWLT